MPTEPAGRLVPVHDTRLFVVERGPEGALPLLVLHGGPGLDHTMFADYLDPLAEEFRLVLVDGRHQGRSDRDTDPRSWTLSQHASDVSAVAAALGAERYAVLGHSFGAFVALQHLADAPGASVGTVISSGVPSTRYLDAVAAGFDSFEPAELRAVVRRSWEKEAEVERDEDVAPLIADQLPWHFADPQDPRIAGYLARLPAMRGSAAVLRAAALEGGGLTIEVEEALPRVTQPVLVLAGRHDRTCVPEASARIAELVPRSRLVVFEGAGHMAFVEDTAAYLDTVRGFLREVA